MKSKKTKKDLKEKDVVIIEDLESPMAKGELVVAKQEAKEFDDESNLLGIVGSVDGIRKIGKMWLTSIELKRIENIMMNHLVRNSVNIEDVGNMLLESLCEIFKEKLSEQSVDVDDL